jgi:Ni,Fe-hydrogenase III small subunit
VASPRHADVIVITGAVTLNMELAVLKTYEAMPSPHEILQGRLYLMQEIRRKNKINSGQ